MRVLTILALLAGACAYETHDLPQGDDPVELEPDATPYDPVPPPPDTPVPPDPTDEPDAGRTDPEPPAVDCMRDEDCDPGYECDEGTCEEDDGPGGDQGSGYP